MFLLVVTKPTSRKNLLAILSKNKKIVPIFSDKDDALRLHGLLEAEDKYPEMRVVQTTTHLIEKLEDYEQPYVIIEPDGFEIPHSGRVYTYIGG